MSQHIRSIVVFGAGLLIAFSATGCAKRPSVAAASAPAPAPPAAVQPAPPSPEVQPTATPESPRQEPSATPTARPAPADFKPNDALQAIHFEFDKSDIRPGDVTILQANAQWLKTNPGNSVLIEGHCDERGTTEYNLALGDRRARSAMNYLVGQGVPSSRMTIVSFGKERPLCSQSNEECWARNRRAMFVTKPQ